MIKEDAVAGEHTVCFAIVNGDPICIKFSDCIRGAGVERSSFFLGHFLHEAIEFRG